MYDSDVSDEEWDLIKHYFDPVDDRGGTGSKHSKRDIVNEIFYLNKTGGSGRMVPKAFPPRETVYGLDNQWSRRNVWEAVLNQLNLFLRKKR